MPRILLVASECPLVRALLSLLDPYEVEVALSGASALARLAPLPSFDLVLCELHLDDLHGRDLYRQACDLCPELRGRFVFMTGDRARPLYDVEEATPVLSRPFEPELLLDVLHDVVTRPPAAHRRLSPFPWMLPSP